MSTAPIGKPTIPTSSRCYNPACDKLLSLIKRCSKCRSAMYCGQDCQRAHWDKHKTTCQAANKAPASQPSPVAFPKPASSRQEIDAYEQTEIGEFTEKDLMVLGCSRKEIERINLKGLWTHGSFSKKTLSCYSFILLEVGEKAAREQTFALSVPKNLSPAQVMDERLKRWGYKVETSAKAGDFVFYHNEKDCGHMGLYLGFGRVKSKLEANSNMVTTHRIDAVFEVFGSKVVFYRKNPHKEGKHSEEGLAKFKQMIKTPR